METAYYKDGILYAVRPQNDALSLYDNRDVAYRATCIVADGKKYNIDTAEGIDSLPIPSFPKTWDTTFEMSYILKIHLSYVSDPKLIPCFVDKVLSLMRASHLLWRRRDYLQVMRNYYKHGLFDAGDEFEQHYRVTYPALFSRPEDDTHESEHTSTKAYFKRKWERKISHS